VKDSLIKPNVIMNADNAIVVERSFAVYIDGNYIGVPLGDKDCSTGKE